MELTPQAVSDAEFREAKRGGYNIRDVDDFLDQIAVSVGQLHERVRDAHHRAEVAEVNLAEAQRQLHQAQQFPPEAGSGAVPGPGPAANGEADETLRRTMMLAQRTADATIAEAKEGAARVLEEARAEAAQVRAKAEAEGVGDISVARAEAERQVAALQEQRAELESDIAKLEDHLQAQRENLRAGLDELQNLLQDREPLQVEPKPSLGEPPNVAPARPGLPQRDGVGAIDRSPPEPPPMFPVPGPEDLPQVASQDPEPPPMFPVPGPEDLPQVASNGFVPGARLASDELSPFGTSGPAGRDDANLGAPPPPLPSRSRNNNSAPNLPGALGRPPAEGVPSGADLFGPPPGGGPEGVGGGSGVPSGADLFGPPPGGGPEGPGTGPGADADSFGAEPERPPLPARGSLPQRDPSLPRRDPEPFPPFEPGGTPPPLPSRGGSNVADLQEFPASSSPFGMPESAPGGDQAGQGIFPSSLGPPPGSTGFLPDLPQAPPEQSPPLGGQNGMQGVPGGEPGAPPFPSPPQESPNGGLPLSIDAPPPPPPSGNPGGLPLDSGDRPSAWGRAGEDGADEEGIRFGRK